MNFAAPLFEWAEREPYRRAVVVGAREYSYGALAERASQFGAALLAAGATHGDHVALMMNNRVEFIIAYYGAAKVGAIIAPFNTFLKGEEIIHQVNDLGAVAFIGNDWASPEFARARAAMPSVSLFVVTQAQHDATQFDDFIAGIPDTGPLYDADQDDVALICYTSGTTGKPKGAMQTHRNIIAFIQATVATQDPAVEYRPLVFVPLFHGFGDHCMMNQVFHTGRDFVLMDPFDPEAILTAIQTYRCTSFGATPSMLWGLLHYPNRARFDTSSLRDVVTGGAPVPFELLEQFHAAFGVMPLEGYGLSEGTAGYTYTRADLPRRPGSCGVALPGVEIRIVGNKGKTLPAGSVGEIVVRSPFNMKGYWRRPESTAAVLQGGWLRTGDVGRLDSDGFLYVVDRKTDMIIMSGENIYPSEIEEVLLRHPAIAEAAVVGVPDQRRGEIPKAVVVLQSGARLTEEDVQAFCRERLAFFKTPKLVEFRAWLPKNAAFKVLKNELKSPCS
ncbi:MAG: class I adenylate-forming enzyme family protein [Candidatus Binatia bacterium]